MPPIGEDRLWTDRDDRPATGPLPSLSALKASGRTSDAFFAVARPIGIANQAETATIGSGGFSSGVVQPDGIHDMLVRCLARVAGESKGATHAKPLDKLTLLVDAPSKAAAELSREWFAEALQVEVSIEHVSEGPAASLAGRDGPTILIERGSEYDPASIVLREAIASGKDLIAVAHPHWGRLALRSDSIVEWSCTCCAETNGAAMQAQLAVLACLAVGLGTERGTLSPRERRTRTLELYSARRRMARAIGLDDSIAAVAAWIARSDRSFIVGGGVSRVLAHEVALRANELGVRLDALSTMAPTEEGAAQAIRDGAPVIVLAPPDESFTDTMTAARALRAFGGRTFVLTEDEGFVRASTISTGTILVPDTTSWTRAMVYSVPMQQLIAHLTPR